jgi:hypothetical protein
VDCDSGRGEAVTKSTRDDGVVVESFKRSSIKVRNQVPHM